MICQLKSCEKCQGDLVIDDEGWRCWQCGRYYYSTPPTSDPPPTRKQEGSPTAGTGERRRGPHRRSVRDINLVIAARDRSEDRWWDRNREVIEHLDEGKSVRDISTLIGRGQRQIRVVRERLRDIRANAAEERAVV